MSWDFSTIKYIFQIPKRWYQEISDKVFHAYGTNFIRVKDGDNGELEIGVNEDAFEDAVKSIAGTGNVTSVDDVEAVDGNVPLGAVRTTTDQTIDGLKKFTEQVQVGSSIYGGQRVELYSSTYPYIDFHSGGSTTDYTSRVIDYGSYLHLRNENVNGVRLQTAPDGTATLAVATVGYVKDNFGTVKTVNNVAPVNGNVTIDVGTSNVKTVDNVGVTSGTTNIALGAVKTTDVETAGTTVSPSGSYSRYACPTAHGHNHDSIVDWDTATEDFGTVKSVDGATPDGNGAVSFGLTGNLWMKTDANGHIAVTTETPIVVDSTYTPQSTTIEVVTKVEWTGTVLRYTTTKYQFVNGALVASTSGSTTTIDTPTVVTWG